MNRGSNWAMTIIDTRPIPNEVACLASRSQFLPLAEYSTNRLPAASVSNRISSGPSMCMRCNSVARRRITSSLERMRSKLLFTGRSLRTDRAGVFGLQPTVLVQKPGVHDLTHHRRCDAGTGLAVLDHHRHHDLRVVSRCEADEQGVVTMALLNLGAVVLLTLLDRDHLGRTTFARDAVLRTDRRFARRTPGTVHHLLHAMVDLGPVGRVAHDDVRHRVVILRPLAFDGLGQVRTVPDTLARDQRCGLGQLQG